MTTAAALNALCEMLRIQTGTTVILGAPDDAVPAIYVWPWKLEEVMTLRNRPPPANPSPGAPFATPAQNIQFLILVRPALTIKGLATLDGVHEAINGHPLLNVDGTNVQILLSPLSTAELTSVFSAASIPLTVCLSAVLKQVR